MKKITTSILAIMLLCSMNVFSQSSGFGLKLGPNFANISGDVSGNSMILYGHFGFYGNIMVNDKFAVHPEVVASGQGCTFKAGSEKVPFTLLYLNIPVLAKYYITETFYAELGPQLGFLTLAGYDNERKIPGTDIEVKDLYKGTDFSLGIGAGYETSGGFNFGLRYNLGLSDINDDASAGTAHNSVIMITIGIPFAGG